MQYLLNVQFVDIVQFIDMSRPTAISRMILICNENEQNIINKIIL